MRTALKYTSLALLIIAFLIVLTGTQGSISLFSPYTLKYESQREYRVLAGSWLVYRSTPKPVENELITFLQETGFVTPEMPEVDRLEVVAHWNSAWRDGYGSVYWMLIREREKYIAWSEEQPTCARIFWDTVFDRLRSHDLKRFVSGHELIRRFEPYEDVETLRERIAFVDEVVAYELDWAEANRDTN
jgi:hypothetical protein